MKLSTWRINRLCKKAEKYSELYGKSVVIQALRDTFGIESEHKDMNLGEIIKKPPYSQMVHTSHDHDNHDHDSECLEEHHLHDHHFHHHSHKKTIDKSHKIKKQVRKNTIIATIEH